MPVISAVAFTPNPNAAPGLRISWSETFVGPTLTGSPSCRNATTATFDRTSARYVTVATTVSRASRPRRTAAGGT
jgi:hypothetical protein